MSIIFREKILSQRPYIYQCVRTVLVHYCHNHVPPVLRRLFWHRMSGLHVGEVCGIFVIWLGVRLFVVDAFEVEAGHRPELEAYVPLFA